MSEDSIRHPIYYPNQRFTIEAIVTSVNAQSPILIHPLIHLRSLLVVVIP